MKSDAAATAANGRARRPSTSRRAGRRTVAGGFLSRQDRQSLTATLPPQMWGLNNYPDKLHLVDAGLCGSRHQMSDEFILGLLITLASIILLFGWTLYRDLFLGTGDRRPRRAT